MRGYGNKNLIIGLKKDKHKMHYNIIVIRKRKDDNSNLENIGRVTFNNRNYISYLYIHTNKLKNYLLKGNIKLTIQVARIFGMDNSLIEHLTKK